MIVVVQLLLLRSSCGGFRKTTKCPPERIPGQDFKEDFKDAGPIFGNSSGMFPSSQLQVFEASSFQLQVFVQIQICNFKFPTSSFQVSTFKFSTSKISTISSSSLQLQVCKLSTSSFQLQVFETSSVQLQVFVFKF